MAAADDEDEEDEEDGAEELELDEQPTTAKMVTVSAPDMPASMHRRRGRRNVLFMATSVEINGIPGVASS